MNLSICQTLQVRIYVRQMSDFRFPRNWSLDNNYNAGTMNVAHGSREGNKTIDPAL